MIKIKGKTLLTTEETARAFGISLEALRQRINRKRIVPVSKVSGRLYFDAKDVRMYSPNRKKLPLFDDLSPQETQGVVFLTRSQTARMMRLHEATINGHIRRGKIKAYCTVDGEVLIPESEIEKHFLGGDHEETNAGGRSAPDNTTGIKTSNDL